MRFVSFVSTAAVLAVALAQPAKADPAEDMCTFVSKLAADGVQPALDFIETLTPHWPDAQREKLQSAVGPAMAKHSYKGGQVFLIADLPGSVREYFLSFNLTDYPASVYARVLYEGDGDRLAFSSIDYEFQYQDIAALRPFMQRPEPVDCGDPVTSPAG